MRDKNKANRSMEWVLSEAETTEVKLPFTRDQRAMRRSNIIKLVQPAPIKVV